MRHIVAVAILVLSVLAAGEGGGKPAIAPGPDNRNELRTQLRQLWDASTKASDLWTALQCEAMARRIDYRLGPALGASEIIGEIIWGFPDEVHRIWDRGDRILVASGSRIFTIAPDGRPLQRSAEAGIALNHAAATCDGSAAGGFERPHGSGSVQVATVALPAGTDLLRRTIAVGPHDVAFGAVIAEDGSAVAGTVETRLDLTPPSPRLLVCRREGRDLGPAIIPGLRDPLAIGPDARWIIARDAASRQLQLISADGANRTRIRAADGAFGWGAIITEDRVLKLVDPQGALVDLPQPMGLGSDARIDTVGQWLVVGSGGDARTQEARDLLDNPVAGGAPQPHLLAIWRWKDLIANRSAPPVELIENRFSRAAHECAAMYLWKGRQVELLDLADAAPVRRPLCTATGDILGVDSQHGRARIHMADDRWLFVNRDGKELWSGSAGWVDLQDRLWGVAWDGPRETRSYRMLRIDLAPNQRKDIPVQLEPGEWSVCTDRLNRRLLANRWGVTWADLDPRSGKQRSQYPWTDLAHPWRWDFWQIGQPNGRFYGVGARVFETGAGEEGVSLAANLHPRDAWRLGPTLVIFCERAQVLMTGGAKVMPGRAKPGEWIDLGRSDGGEQLAQRGRNNDLVICDWGMRVESVLASGPSLKPDPSGERASPLPPGPWQVDGLRFVPPRQPQLSIWNRAATGFTPRRYRSPDSASLLAITGSVILDIDHQVGRQIAKPVAARE